MWAKYLFFRAPMVIEQRTVRGSTIRGTQKMEREDELALEVAELKATVARSEAENRALRAEKTFDRHEVAELKAD